MITLLVLGTILLLAETILPGLVAGIFGCLCLIFGITLGYLILGLRTGNLILLGVVLVGIPGAALWIKYFPESSLARVFVSQGTVGNINAEKPELLHRTGTASSALRPCGIALIDGRRVDVVTEGSMVAKGTPVKVIAIEGMRVVVRPV